MQTENTRIDRMSFCNGGMSNCSCALEATSDFLGGFLYEAVARVRCVAQDYTIVSMDSLYSFKGKGVQLRIKMLLSKIVIGC